MTTPAVTEQLAIAVARQRARRVRPLRSGTWWNQYTTALPAQAIPSFRAWKARYAPRDSGIDYDLPGAFAAGITPDPATGHWPDTFKKPNEPTFSNESQYAKLLPQAAGYWSNGRFVPKMAFGR
jgi:hypothetical protein